MLDALRRGASGWIAKIFLSILILSFAVWGVADVFRGYGAGSLARVGDTEITPDEFQTAYQNQLQMLGQLGRRLTPEQARQFGLDVRALYGLIDTAAVDNHARSLQLGISDEAVAQQIAREPSFRTADGKFDKLAFQSYLTQIRMSEAGFIAQRRKDEVREQLTGALLGGLTIPDALIEELHRWSEETRKIAFLTLPEAAVTVPDADEAKLKETYETAKRQFVVPESRTLSLLLLELAEVKSRVVVTDDDIKAYFDKNRAALDVPERRRIQQIAFKDRAAADATRKQIDGGKGFMMVALETEGAAGRMPGLLARSDIGDLKFAEVAFTLAKDKVSDVIQTASGPVLLMVSEIVPGRAVSLDDVKADVRERLTTEKVNAEMNSLHDAVDNNRAARKPLKEIGETLNLKHIEVTTDATNRGADGKPVLQHDEATDIVARGFQGAVGVEVDPIELKAGGFGWVDVLATVPEKEKPLASVLDEVKAVYIDATRRRMLGDLAAKIAERVGNGEALDAIAKEVGGKVETTDAINRSTTPQGLSSPAVQIAFTTAKSKATSAESADRKSRTVMQVVEITPAAAASKEQTDRIKSELSRQLQNDTIQAYSAALRERLGVTINEAALRRLTGADRQQ
jgi:peptidyl-prolyl cis-trans isomerase D